MNRPSRLFLPHAGQAVVVRDKRRLHRAPEDIARAELRAGSGLEVELEGHAVGCAGALRLRKPAGKCREQQAPAQQ